MFGGIDIPQESKKEQQKADANDDVYIIRIGLSKFLPLSGFYTILIFASKIQIFFQSLFENHRLDFRFDHELFIASSLYIRM